MALTWILTKENIASDASGFDISDDTVYGGANVARNQRANVFFCPKTDADGVRTLQDVVPDNADPTLSQVYTVTSTQDGWIEKIMASVSLYDSAGYGAAGIVFYDSGVFYKTKSAVPPSTPAPDGTYYDVITAASLYTDELANSSIEWVMQDDLMTSRAEDRLRKEYVRVKTDFVQGKAKYEDYNEADKIDSQIQAAYSALLDQVPQDAETIIRALENYVISYGQV